MIGLAVPTSDKKENAPQASATFDSTQLVTTESTPTEETTTEEAATTQEVESTQQAGTSGATTEEASRETAECRRAGQILNNYDILAEGASRADYLRLLHRLQAYCGYTAKRLGLTATFLKKCPPNGWEKENCTMFDPALWKG